MHRAFAEYNYILCTCTLALSSLVLNTCTHSLTCTYTHSLPHTHTHTHTHTYADSVDNETYSPLHMASRHGHTAIIVALVEEGRADVNVRGGEQGDTPLMLSVCTCAPSVFMKCVFYNIILLCAHAVLFVPIQYMFMDVHTCNIILVNMVLYMYMYMYMHVRKGILMSVSLQCLHLWSHVLV